MMRLHEAMRRLAASGLLPERAGQPVKAWAHVSLAELCALDAGSVLQGEWITAVQAKWAGARASASVAGGDGAAWLDGPAARAVTCDAIITPDRHRRRRHRRPGPPGQAVRPARPPRPRRRPGQPARRPRRCPRIDVPGPRGPAESHHRQGRRPAVRPWRPGQLPAHPAARRPPGRPEPAAGHRLLRDRPGRDPQRGHLAGPALPVGRRLPPARRGLRGPPRQAQGRRRPHQRHRLRAAVLLPPPGVHPPLGLDPGPEPRRHHHRLEPRPHQSPPQPQPPSKSRVTPRG